MTASGRSTFPLICTGCIGRSGSVRQVNCLELNKPVKVKIQQRRFKSVNLPRKIILKSHHYKFQYVHIIRWTTFQIMYCKTLKWSSCRLFWSGDCHAAVHNTECNEIDTADSQHNQGVSIVQLRPDHCHVTPMPGHCRTSSINLHKSNSNTVSCTHNIMPKI